MTDSTRSSGAPPKGRRRREALRVALAELAGLTAFPAPERSRRAAFPGARQRRPGVIPPVP